MLNLKLKIFILIIFLIFLPSFTHSTSVNLIINEIMYNLPGSDKKHEWVEVKNIGNEAITIIGGSGSGSWRFFDGSNHIFAKEAASGSMTINPGDFAILADDAPTFLADHPNFQGTVIDTTMSLNNTQDTLKLSTDEGKTWFSEITYQKENGGAGNGKSLEWDGQKLLESKTDGGTPGKENSVVTNQRPPPPTLLSPTSGQILTNPKPFFDWEDSTDPDGDKVKYFFQISVSQDFGNLILTKENLEKSEYQVESDIPIGNYFWHVRASDGVKESDWSQVFGFSIAFNYSKEIRVNEIFPDPASPLKDSEDEWIEIYNFSQNFIDLSGWVLEDGEGRTTSFKIPDGTLISSKDYLIFYARQTNISLNNEGDYLKLIAPNGELISQSENYGKAKEGWSFNYTPSWSWSATPTPGKENLISQPSQSKNQSSNSKEKKNILTPFSSLLPQSLKLPLSPGLTKLPPSPIKKEILSSPVSSPNLLAPEVSEKISLGLSPKVKGAEIKPPSLVTKILKIIILLAGLGLIILIWRLLPGVGKKPNNLERE